MNRDAIIKILIYSLLTGAIIGWFDFISDDSYKKIILNGKTINYNFIEENDNLYVDFQFLKDNLNLNIRMNEKKTRVYIKPTYIFKDEEIENLVKVTEVELNVHTLNKDKKNYVPLKDVALLSGLQISKKFNRLYISQLKENYQQRLDKKSHMKGKITLAWEGSGTKTPNIEDENKKNGLKIVSPIWFNIVNTQGIVVNSGQHKYMKDAKEKGYHIWATVKNNFDPKLTRSILRDVKTQDKVIAQLILFSKMYDLEGINIDFENIYYEDSNNLTEFIKKIRYYTEKAGLYLSMDVTVPDGSKNWSLVYDRKNLQRYVDYMMLMAYDEHWATSPKSGSVASINWVELGIKNSLKVIPKEKLVLGMPFYTRIWKETSKGKNIKVSAKAIIMSKIENVIESAGVTPVWNDTVAQEYVEYKEDNNTYKIWVENKKSIEEKIKLAQKYELGGICAWRKGFEKEEIWDLFEKYLKGN